MAKDNSGFRIDEITELLPHRYPFLLIDRVTELVPGKYIKGFKNVTMNEPFFQGHFPGEPIMPGVLILESMAQLGILFAKKTAMDELSGKLLVFAGMDGVRFRRPVVPGDRLEIELHMVKKKRIVWKMAGLARVDGEEAVEATLMAAVQG